MHQADLIDRCRRALRRPRHRPARRVRARGQVVHIDVDPSEIGKIRHADLPVVGELARRLQRARAWPALRRRRGPAAEWRRTIAAWRGASRCATRARGGRAAATAAGGRAPGGGGSEPRGRGLDDRGRPAPDVGDAVPALRAGRARSSPPAVTGRWASGCRRRSGRGPRGRGRRSSASTATAPSR